MAVFGVIFYLYMLWEVNGTIFNSVERYLHEVNDQHNGNPTSTRPAAPFQGIEFRVLRNNLLWSGVLSSYSSAFSWLANHRLERLATVVPGWHLSSHRRSTSDRHYVVVHGWLRSAHLEES